MPRATISESDSESERVPPKKQKKRQKTPVDVPMDQEEEFEIEKIVDASNEIFKDDGEMAYFVKWKGFGEEDNSWVRESDAPNADELISQFLDEKRANEKAKKAAARSRKSTGSFRQEPKKRARVSTKSKPYSDEDEPELSPVQPIAKKQKKGPVPTKKAGPNHNDKDVDPEGFASMAKYMNLDSWEELIHTVDTIERDGDDLFVYGTLTTKEHFRLPSSITNPRFPQKLLKFYEHNLRWKATDDAE